MSAFVDGFLLMPATWCILLVCTSIWFYLWNKRISAQAVAFHYERVVNDAQHWRIVTSSLSHLSFMHIGFNMYSLYQFGILEHTLGTLEYLKLSYILLVGSMIFIIGSAYWTARLVGDTRQQQVWSLGYSCVVFGIMTVFSQLGSGEISMFGVPLPSIAAPFIALGITQVLVPNASFIGHLAGIVVGFLYAYRVFFWMDDYTFGCLVVWTVVNFLFSLKRTTAFNLPFLTIDAAGDAGVGVRRGRMINGVLVYPNNRNDIELGAMSAADNGGVLSPAVAASVPSALDEDFEIDFADEDTMSFASPAVLPSAQNNQV
jgi:membrane associated rhomboid family serine protease